MKFTCDNCGTEASLGLGATDMTCSECGCNDLKFDMNVKAFPRKRDSSFGQGVIFKAGDSFFGMHSMGTIWRFEPIDLPKESTKVVSEKDEVEEEDRLPSDVQEAKKMKLAKAIRRVKE